MFPIFSSSVCNNGLIIWRGANNTSFHPKFLVDLTIFSIKTCLLALVKMSLYDEHMDFRTLYRLEYTPKKGLVFPYSPPHDSNPVSSPWQRYLVPDESLKHLLPADGVYEDPACVLHRAKIKEMPDVSVLKHEYSHPEPTIYQNDFCKAGDFESKATRNARIVSLPPHWQTPLSTQRCSYRDPKSVLDPSLTIPPAKFSYRDNLVPNVKEREILRVCTGDSDYMAGIGALGDFIVTEKLHGEVKPSGISVWDIERRLALLNQGILPEDDPAGQK